MLCFVWIRQTASDQARSQRRFCHAGLPHPETRFRDNPPGALTHVLKYICPGRVGLLGGLILLRHLSFVEIESQLQLAVLELTLFVVEPGVRLPDRISRLFAR